MGTAVAFIEPGDLVEATKAVVRLHRDWGDRGNRRHARLKYVIAERGEEWARERLSEDLGKTLEPCRTMAKFQVPDHLGWHEQGDGKLYLGLPISSGRIIDDDRSKLRTALHEIVAEFGVDPILMSSQDIILSEIDPSDRDTIEARLRAYGIRFGADMAPAQRWALACPALPTCGLALTEAERVSDLLVAEIVERMARCGVEQERVSIRITGCPNGCARPYSGDIGIVGRIPGFYSIYVGGDFEGTRLNEVVAERIRLGEVADVLEPLFAVYAKKRGAEEGFGDFCHRYGVVRLRDELAAARGKARDAAD